MADPTTVGTYICICRRAFVELVADEDEVIPGNIGALALGMMGHQFQFVKNDPDRSALYWGPNYPEKTGKMAGAFDVLDEERRESEQAEVPTISFHRDFGAGSIASIR